MIGGRWVGIDEALEALAGVATEVARDDQVAKAMLAVTRPIATEMGEALYQRVTRRTGETGGSIEAARVDEGVKPGTVAVEIGPRVRSDGGWRVKFWEFGTSRLPARPFMRPVWDEREASFAADVTAELRKVYEVAARRRSRRGRA
jgi:HK97 gp10 family phage protein